MWFCHDGEKEARPYIHLDDVISAEVVRRKDVEAARKSKVKGNVDK